MLVRQTSLKTMLITLGLRKRKLKRSYHATTTNLFVVYSSNDAAQAIRYSTTYNYVSLNLGGILPSQTLHLSIERLYRKEQGAFNFVKNIFS